MPAVVREPPSAGVPSPVAGSRIALTEIINLLARFAIQLQGHFRGDKHRIVAALRPCGAGSCPRCSDSQWTSANTRDRVQATMERDTAEIDHPPIRIGCENCGFIRSMRPAARLGRTTRLTSFSRVRSLDTSDRLRKAR